MTNSTELPHERPNVGLVLAAGSGSRMGQPKALVRGVASRPWLEQAIALLQSAGCDPVVVVLGAEADAAARLIPAGPGVVAVTSDNWSRGMGESLRDGMAAAERYAATAPAVVITLVDLPGLTPDVVTRVADGATPSSLRQATFGSRPGHPVVVGRDHWSGFTASLTGDTGGKHYLREAGATQVECGDLGDGRDVDTAEQLRRDHGSPTSR